ncbi:hypothetical protein ECHWAK_0431 [Ehrlichia chaffeensis str. Wakulla]|nr:hypothetical protein ECHWAK_0431 [Ehrlichia chaffeensis str. Wakulla]
MYLLMILSMGTECNIVNLCEFIMYASYYFLSIKGIIS